MPLTFEPEAPPLRADEDGAVRVGGTKVVLDLVVDAHRSGATPEDIVRMYPGLTLADAYAAVAHYLRHTAEVDAYMAERERAAAEIRWKIEAIQGDQTGLRERLMGRGAVV